MPFVLSLKSVRVSSLSGHCVVVESETPTFVPVPLLKEAIASGCILCNEKGEALINGKAFKLVPSDTPVEVEAPPGFDHMPASREAKISKAVNSLLEEGNPQNLNWTNGYLKATVVSEQCGFKVSSEEIRNLSPVADAAA